MKKYTKTYGLLWLCFILCLGNLNTLNAQRLERENEMIVAYYGRPGVASMGVLGQYSVDDLVPVVKAKAHDYGKIMKGTTMIPAFDVIFDMASMDPGPRGDYIVSMSEEKIMTYINKAEEEGFYVFIDLQLGKNTPLQSVKRVLKYLKYKSVHIAIDPEFEVKGLNVRPGKVIGQIDGSDVNQVQEAMADYLKQNNIKEEKYLVVHQFRHKMVENKSEVKFYDGINLIMNLDGHGPPSTKINIYNSLYNNTTAGLISGGFKLFFKEDHPMMTPREALGFESVNGLRIRDMPRYINYQ